MLKILRAIKCRLFHTKFHMPNFFFEEKDGHTYEYLGACCYKCDRVFGHKEKLNEVNEVKKTSLQFQLGGN